MFAGAAREAVFSKPDVIRKIKSDFIPVALKAGSVMNPPDNLEGQLYRELARSRPAPQGIGVTNSAGKVLAWTLMFEKDAGVAEFLDYALKRYQKFPNAKKPVTVERFMQFPGRKLADVKDNGKQIEVPENAKCRVLPLVEKGTLVGRIVGRALDKDENLVKDVLAQEKYVEARVEVPVRLQTEFVKAWKQAGKKRFALPTDFSLVLVSHAYLGQLDVNPLGGRRVGGKTDWERMKFQVQEVMGPEGVVRLRIEGTSDVAGSQGNVGARTDGRRWVHEVKLAWEGYVDLKQDRMVRMVVVARGFEKLRWGNPRRIRKGDAVSYLPAGRALDVKCGVRYGLILEPASDREVGDN